MKRFAAVFIALFWTLTPAWAADTIGYVKTASGKAEVIDAGKAVSARVGTPIQMGNLLKTGPDGSLGITFRDNTVMSFGPTRS